MLRRWRRTELRLVFAFGLIAGAVLGQVASIDVAGFEVASVKPSAPGNPGMSTSRKPGGRVLMENVTPRWLITQTWGIGDYQLIGAPAWFDSEHFDIEAKPESAIPDSPEGAKTLALMVQKLVADRFALVFHNETRMNAGYELVVAKGGAKLKAVAEDREKNGGRSYGNGVVSAQGVRVRDLAEMLSGEIRQMVIDKTGLTELYDFRLKWAPDVTAGPDPAKPSDTPGLFTAIQEQLGLKLEARKVPVQVMVIDKAERPSAN